ncbi:MAG: DUF424 family protein [Promethearchaeota archaeon]
MLGKKLKKNDFTIIIENLIENSNRIMKVYLKIHHFNSMETVACCDEELLNQVFKEGNLRIEISDQFFGGNLIKLEKAIEILKEVSFFNIVGENIIKKAIDYKILSKNGFRYINGIPMALKMMF